MLWNGNSDNNMALHTDKFEYMNHAYGDAKLLKHLPFTSEYYEYKTPDGVTITPKDVIRDLGVLISSDLSWGPHIDNITDATWKMCSWILSVFETRDEETLIKVGLHKSTILYIIILYFQSYKI